MPDDSDSDDDSSSSRDRVDSEGGMAVPDQEVDSPKEPERERERPPKEPKEPEFGEPPFLQRRSSDMCLSERKDLSKHRLSASAEPDTKSYPSGTVPKVGLP